MKRRVLSVRLRDLERDKLDALSADTDRTTTATIERLIRKAYLDHFGDVPLEEVSKRAGGRP